MRCHDYTKINKLNAEEGTTCVTKHQGVKDVFVYLSIHSIKTMATIYSNIQKRRQAEGMECNITNQPHKTFRHIAYKAFVFWVWGKTGYKNNKILPVCPKKVIQEKWPSEAYTGAN